MGFSYLKIFLGRFSADYLITLLIEQIISLLLDMTEALTVHLGLF